MLMIKKLETTGKHNVLSFLQTELTETVARMLKGIVYAHRSAL